MSASRVQRRLAGALVVLLGCSQAPPPPGGLLSSPAGEALAGTLLFVANQDQDELHVFDTLTDAFRPAPNWMFPLSIPTVRRPGPVCGNTTQIFTASSVDPVGAFIDANDNGFDDGGSADPVNPGSGLVELGQLALPGVPTDAVCAPEPGAVLAHQLAVAGSIAAYPAAVSSILDVPPPDGGLDERHFIARLPMAVFLPINSLACQDGGCPTTIWEATNDITGASCDAGAPAFCPSLKPLLTLPPQPASCQPWGPPRALRVDVSGANAGLTNAGVPNVEPATLNQLVASDKNSNCVYTVNLGDPSGGHWIPTGLPSKGVFVSPHIHPLIGLNGGDLFAVVADGEQCERQGPPPVGGYTSCDGVSFGTTVTGDGGMLLEPLAYPFVPRRPAPPLRINDPVTQVAFLGANLQITAFSTALIAPVPLQLLAVVATTGGSFLYVDIGFGAPGAGTGPSTDAGVFPFPPAYLAPRLFDTGDYVASPGPTISVINLYDAIGGTTLGGLAVATTNQVFTADGGPVPLLDRQDAGFLTAVDISGNVQPPVTCWSSLTNSQLCVTEGLAQKGVNNDETFVVTYEGMVKPFAGVACQLVGRSLQFGYAPFEDLTHIDDGLLVREAANLQVELSSNGAICGEYVIGDGGVSSGGIDLALQSGPGCPGAGAQLLVTIFAGGAKPYTVEGSTTGFISELWPADGTLHLVPGTRWQYPADLLLMEQRAQQLVDLVYGSFAAPLAPGSALSVPTAQDYQALDAQVGLSVFGPLGPLDEAGVAVVPQRGANWAFGQSAGVYPLAVSPLDLSSYIQGLVAFTDTVDGGTPNLYGTFRGGSTLILLDPDLATSAAIFEVH